MVVEIYIMVTWIIILCSLAGGCHRFEEITVSGFRVEVS
jgi:hypothetical protein